MTQHTYQGSNALVNNRLLPVHPGEIRAGGGVRLYPTLDAGNSTIRIHVTNEVDMFIAHVEARLAYARAVIWCVVIFLSLFIAAGVLDGH